MYLPDEKKGYGFLRGVGKRKIPKEGSKDILLNVLDGNEKHTEIKRAENWSKVHLKAKKSSFGSPSVGVYSWMRRLPK